MIDVGALTRTAREMTTGGVDCSLAVPLGMRALSLISNRDRPTRHSYDG
jgi:hypothetical protein